MQTNYVPAVSIRLFLLDDNKTMSRMQPVFLFFFNYRSKKNHNENCWKNDEKNEMHSDKNVHLMSRWFRSSKKKKLTWKKEQGRTLMFSIQVNSSVQKEQRNQRKKKKKREESKESDNVPERNPT